MADHNNAKDAVTAWLNESEGFSLRIERLHEDAASGNDLVPWLVEAFRLGADRAAPEGQVQCCMCGRKDLSTIEGDGGEECQLWDGRWTCSRGCYDKACMIHEAALTPPPAAQEPVAWMFELATMQDAETGEYGGWEGTKLGLCKPKVPEGSIRNLMPLYAAPPPPCQKEAVTDAELAKARAEIERLTKERDLSKELLRSCIQGNNVLRKKAQKAIAERDEARSMLADAERDMRQRAADSCLGLMTAQSARKFILALPLKHADRENDAALAQGQKEGD